MPRRLPLLTLSALAAALSACGSDAPDAPQGQGEDPAYAQALAGPLMTDPDLATRNHALMAVNGGGPEVITAPSIEDGPEVITAAKEEALALAGGKIEPAPFPADGSNPALLSGVTAAQRAAAVKGPGSGCAAKAGNAMAWSLQLPQALPIYPRGHLIEAAGNNAAGCTLRVVRFVTPVAPGDVIDFYNSRAITAHLDLRHVAADGVQVLEGGKGAGVYAVQARRRGDGLTEADIVVNGL